MDTNFKVISAIYDEWDLWNERVLNSRIEVNELEREALNSIEQIAKTINGEDDSILETLWKMRMVGKHAQSFVQNNLE